MRSRLICLIALVVWVLGIGVAGWLFLKGWTTPGADGRTEIRLAPSERDRILAEMRQLLESVQGVLTGLSADPRENGRRSAEQAARRAGMGMAADVDPAVMAKLPLAFKQMGMSVHRDFDGLADDIGRGEKDVHLLGRLSGVIGRCTTCHALYRFSAGRAG